jgi:hypothetical protein
MNVLRDREEWKERTGAEKVEMLQSMGRYERCDESRSCSRERERERVNE